MVEDVTVEVLVFFKSKNDNEIVVVENVNLTNPVIRVPDSSRNVVINMVNQEVSLPVFDSAGSNVDSN